jgi:integrase
MKKPKAKKDEVQTDAKSLTLEESRRLIACLKDEPIMWRALIMFYLDSGCRRGEAVAMRWEDVDLKTGRIDIKGNAQYTVDKGKYVTTPKSGNGRTVFLNAPVLAVLKEWKREQTKWLLSMGLPHTGFVFTQDDGEMLNPNAPTKYLSKFGKKYGFPGLHPHTLRHTMATISIANNADIVSISKKLGHAAPSITLNVYSHANQEAQLRANKTLETALYKNA